MSHLAHIARNKKHLEVRSAIIRAIREFFWSRGFLEMETPNLVRFPGQEPNLSPMRAALHDERGREYPAYLHTSPEYTMKKMLAAGFEKIFSLGKVFRDYESFGGMHNPEFTMIEWYRVQEDMFAIMRDVEELFQYLEKEIRNSNIEIRNKSKLQNSNTKTNNQISDFGFRISDFSRLHMRDAWQEYAGVNLDDYLTCDAIFALCKQKGYAPKEDERYEELFYRIFLNEIEPHLGVVQPLILHHYPAPMAALARLSPEDPRYAQRFEVYVNGMEIANCFSELTDAIEQRRRFLAEREERRAAGKDVYDIDEEFLEALKRMPPSAGIALGVDRLVMVLTGCKNINDVLPLPASQLFELFLYSFAMGDTTDIRKGAIIRRDGNLYVVTGFQFVNPGKGSAFTKTKMKSITTGKSVEITYKSGESVDTVSVERINMQYLYGSGNFYSFMNQSTYETVEVHKDILGDDAKYLKEGLDVLAVTHEGRVVAVELPKKITYKVVEAPPAVKGDTAGGNVTKEVILDNGLKVHAPIFIKEGEEIIVNTETSEYGGRASEK